VTKHLEKLQAELAALERRREDCERSITELEHLGTKQAPARRSSW